MTPFYRSRTSSCWNSIVTVDLSCIISEIKRDIGQKSQSFHTPPAFDAVRGPRRNIAIRFGREKLEWCGYPMVKKLLRYI